MRDRRKSKEKRKKKKGKSIFLVLLLIIAILAGIFTYKVYKNGGGLGGIIATTLGHDEETLNKLPKMYCLILGKSQNLTDTIMVASYDPKSQEAALLSIPRDTFIGENRSTATPWYKINAVYQTGVENVLEDVRELTGLDIRYYIMVDTEALKVLVDKIGGVKFNVPIDMDYDDNKQDLHIHLKAGEQLLDGDKAEQVVRFRHNKNGTTYPSSYGEEDLGRMRTQREFLTEVAKQTLLPKNLTKIPEFIDIAKKYVETNLDFDKIKDYIPYAINYNLNNLKTDKLPGVSSVANGYWFYFVDEEEAKEVINRLFFEHDTVATENNNETNTINNETTNEETTNNTEKNQETVKTDKEEKSKINIEVLNGSSNSSYLSEIVSELKAAGYNVEKTGRTTKTSVTTIINRRDVSEDVKEELKNILDIKKISKGQSSGEIDVTIIIGTDYVS